MRGDGIPYATDEVIECRGIDEALGGRIARSLLEHVGLAFYGGGGGGGGGAPDDDGIRLPYALYAFGNAQGVGPRLNRDIFPDDEGLVGPEHPPWPHGQSAFRDPDQPGLTGVLYRLVAGTRLPRGLGVIADGTDASPNSPHPVGHHTLFPTQQMPYPAYVSLVGGLPWQKVGRRR